MTKQVHAKNVCENEEHRHRKTESEINDEKYKFRKELMDTLKEAAKKQKFEKETAKKQVVELEENRKKMVLLMNQISHSLFIVKVARSKGEGV